MTQAQAKRLAAAAVRVGREVQELSGLARKVRGTPMDRQIQDFGIVAMFQRGEVVGVGPEQNPMVILSISRTKGTLVVAPQDQPGSTNVVEPCDVAKDPVNGSWPDELFVD